MFTILLNYFSIFLKLYYIMRDSQNYTKKTKRVKKKKYRNLVYTQKAGKSILGRCYIIDLPNNNVKVIIGRRRYYEIAGHTDSQGNDQRNQALSERRASAVRQYLIANMAIPEVQISAVGYGESQPLASNESREGRAKNRRIDVRIVLPEI